MFELFCELHLRRQVYQQLEELPEKWANTKKISATVRQGLAPLQNHEVNRIRQEALRFDALQHEFRWPVAHFPLEER